MTNGLSWSNTDTIVIRNVLGNTNDNSNMSGYFRPNIVPCIKGNWKMLKSSNSQEEHSNSYPELLNIFGNNLIFNVSNFWQSQNVGIVQNQLFQFINIRTAKYQNCNIHWTLSVHSQGLKKSQHNFYMVWWFNRNAERLILLITSTESPIMQNAIGGRELQNQLL